jgi:hypothetical protein
MLSDPDPAKAGRVMDAMLQMNKLDTGALRAAYDGAERTAERLVGFPAVVAFWH